MCALTLFWSLEANVELLPEDPLACGSIFARAMLHCTGMTDTAEASQSNLCQKDAHRSKAPTVVVNQRHLIIAHEPDRRQSLHIFIDVMFRIHLHHLQRAHFVSDSCSYQPNFHHPHVRQSQSCASDYSSCSPRPPPLLNKYTPFLAAY